jgi:Carboxypeptidase regulatory-like domain
MIGIGSTIILAAFLSQASADHEGAARVTVSFARHGVAATEGTITLSRFHNAPQPGPDTIEPIRTTVRFEGPATFDLPRGQWKLTVDAPGVWHAPAFFTPEDGSTVAVDLWPEARLQAAVTTDDGRNPSHVRIRFEPATIRTDSFPAGEVECPVNADDRTFPCSLPAGIVNLRIRPRGYISHYVQALALLSGESRNLGSLSFRRGQAITGRVALPPESKIDPAAITVTATPDIAKGAVGRLLAIQAKPRKDGFFHLDGLPPGDDIVGAALRRELYSEKVVVPVREGVEADLVEPLQLHRPRRITITLTPALAPSAGAWRVRLSRSAADVHWVEVTESPASLDGMWQSPALQPGRYRISVASGVDDVWHEEEIVLGPADHEMAVLLRQLEITGAVSLGKRPLEAALTFSNGAGVKVKTQSDAEGTFTLVVPVTPKDRWNVAVESDAPPVQRTVAGVEIPRDAAEPRSVRIELPDSVLHGTVVDSAGVPVADALLFISRGDLKESLVQPRSGADGSFSIHGLSTGNYVVIASSLGRESEPMEVSIEEDEPAAPVRIVLRDTKRLQGRIVSDFGPVAGARLGVYPTDVPLFVTSTVVSDTSGRFFVDLPASAQLLDIDVAAAGYSYSLAEITFDPRPLIIKVDQQGGLLTVTAANPDELALVHNGGVSTVKALTYRLRPHVQREGAQGPVRMVFPAMEAGPYTVCAVEPAAYETFRRSNGQLGGRRCASGFLAPRGTLTLTVE